MRRIRIRRLRRRTVARKMNESSDCGCSSNRGVRESKNFLDVQEHRSDITEHQVRNGVDAPRYLSLEEYTRDVEGSSCGDRSTSRGRAPARERDHTRGGCGTDPNIFYRYDWNAFLPLLDRSRDVELVEDEERAGSPGPRVRIIEDLETVQATAPSDWADLDIKTHGPG